MSLLVESNLATRGVRGLQAGLSGRLRSPHPAHKPRGECASSTTVEKLVCACVSSTCLTASLLIIPRILTEHQARATRVMGTDLDPQEFPFRCGRHRATM